MISRVFLFFAAAVVASLLFIQWCDLVYQCGCRAWWNGAADHCNIHNPEPPHCPWCIQGGAGGYASFGLILLTQAVITLRPGPRGLLSRLLWALLVFPIVGSVTAVGLGWYTGYWSGT